MGSVLSRFEMKCLEAFADALIPPGGTIPEGASEIGVAAAADRWVGTFGRQSQLMVRAMLLGFEASPLLSAKPNLFHRLSPAERDAWISGTDGSKFRPRRETLAGLGALVYMLYATDPRIQARIGYDGLPIKPVDWSQVPAPVRLPVLQWPDARPGDIEADVVIVGTGAGGAVAADVLARAGHRVVLLEEGAFFNREFFHGRPMTERLSIPYRDNGLTATIGTPIISMPMGRAVGGTTVINSGTCFRTPDFVLDEWRKLGIPGVAPEDMAPVFDAVEEILGVQPVPDDVLGPNGAVVARGAGELGYSGGPIPRFIRGCHGHGVCAFGCPLDAKQAMHVSYLPRAVEAGATIYAHVRAKRVWIQAGRAVGVIADLLDPVTEEVRGSLRVRARATIMAAGAIYTPALLRRQKIANTSGQLGKNLVIHPGSGVTARFDEELYAWKGTMQSYYIDEKLREGILFEATFPPPGVGYSAGSLPGKCLEKKDRFAQYPHMAAGGSIVNDGPNGSVRPLGKNGAFISYRLSQQDADKIVESVAMAAEVYFAAGAKEVFVMMPGLPSISSRSEIRAIREGHWRPKDLKLSAYHPMGTARMGTDPRRSVVDPWGAVWDVPGLFVLDASIMPSSTHVNPQITIMSMVTRSATHLADRLS